MAYTLFFTFNVCAELVQGDPMRPYSVVLFDIDGTLVDSADAVADGIRHALSVMGLPDRPVEELRRFVGPPLWDTFAEYGMSREDQDKAVLAYREYYHNIFLDPPLFPGVKNALAELHAAGIPQATATSKYVVMAQKQMEFLDVAQYFDVIAGAPPTPGSTKETVIRDALAQLEASGRDVSRPVLVGDRCFDVEGAREVGIPVIGVEWGYALEGEFDTADAVVATPGDLVDLLLGRA